MFVTVACIFATIIHMEDGVEASNLLRKCDVKANLLLYHYEITSFGEKFPFHCPYCGKNTVLTRDNFSSKVHYDEDRNFLYLISFITCGDPKCGKITVLGEEIHLKKRYNTTYYDNIIDLIMNDEEGFNNVILSTTLYCFIPAQENPDLIFPHYDDKDNINDIVLEDYFELQRVSQISPLASMILSRRLLERMILDKWPNIINERKWKHDMPTLKEMIDWLDEEENGQKRYNDTDIMQYIRQIGNKTVHVDSGIERVKITAEEVRVVIEELDSIINEFYVLPNKREKAKRRIKELSAKLQNNS